MRMKKPEIIYEDKDILVCRKPVGVPVQTRSNGMQDMVSLLKNYRASKGEEPYIGVVHRLDQPVEGVMVYGKTKKAASGLSAQITNKTVDKFYYAVVKGIPKPEKGTLTDFLRKDGRTNLSQVVSEGTKEAKKAVLSYEVLEAGIEKSLVEIKLETGRHHQIRVQMAHRGFPLLGDHKYGETEGTEQISLALCSYYIGFKHPGSGKDMSFQVKPEGEGFHDYF